MRNKRETRKKKGEGKRDWGGGGKIHTWRQAVKPTVYVKRGNGTGG